MLWADPCPVFRSVPEGVRGNAFGDGRPRCGLFDGTLNMGLMKVRAPLFLELGNKGEGGCREEPLPDVLFGGVIILLLELPGASARPTGSWLPVY